MKISVYSTFSFIKLNLNYGSLLQMFALQKYLKNRGNEVEHIRDYRANPIIVLRRLKRIKYPKQFFSYARALAKEQRFLKKNVALSAKGYLSERKMKKSPPAVDCFIVGSDQVWHNSVATRYLSYAPDDKMKLSYAASFGSVSISNEVKEIIKPLLSRFDGISVREASGVKIVNDMGFDAVHLLDPTLLLDWDSYPYRGGGGFEKKNYCLCYFLNVKNKADVPIEVVDKFCNVEKIENYVVSPTSYPLFIGENLYFPGVEEWLGMYKYAEYVFTNTFHGLLFCIIFKKQFLFCTQKGRSSSENERFYSIIEMLHLEDRLIEDFDYNTIAEKLKTLIDYDVVYEIIQEKRKETDSFFEKYGI